MAIDPCTVTIDGFEYRITPLGARRAKKSLRRLVRGIGPALASLLGGQLAGELDLGSMDVASLGQAFREAFDRMPDREIEEIEDEMLAGVSLVEPERIIEISKVFDTHFQGRLASQYQVIWASMRLNFADFFGVFAGPGKKERAAPPSAASTTS